MELLREQLPAPDSQVGRLLEILSPDKCGEDSEEVAMFIREVARHQPLWERAVQTLACFENSAATDGLIDILEEAKTTTGFEKAALIAIGANGRYKRPLVAAYLSELKDVTFSDKLQKAIKAFSG